MDVPVFSLAVGIRKPDLRIYRLAWQRLQLELGEYLFIGDGGSRELAGAVLVGVMAIQLRNADENPEEAARFGPEIWNGPVLSRWADLLTIALE